MPSYIPIIQCQLCISILQKQSTTNEALPVAEKLTSLGGELKQCKTCGSYYHYSHEHDPGEPMVMASDSYTLVRLNPCSLKKVLPHLPNELEHFNNRYTDLVASLMFSLANEWEGMNWQIKKYHIEFLSDHFLLNNDWEGIRSHLLMHKDAVVKVETALDLLYIITEEYPVWCVRYFSNELKENAQYLLSIDNPTNLQELIWAFVENMSNTEISYALDSFSGYRKVNLQYQCYTALSNAVYRQLDISIAVTNLFKWLTQDHEWYRDNGLFILKKHVENKVEFAQYTLELLENTGIDKRNRYIKAFKKHCLHLLTKK